jgi:hypothetical protein
VKSYLFGIWVKRKSEGGVMVSENLLVIATEK